MALVDETGFTQKTQNEYFDEETQLYLAIDPDWNLDPSTPDGLKLASDSEVFGNLDEALLAAYNSKDPDRAMDGDLDALLQISGLTRLTGSGSTATISIGGTNGTTIPAGSKARSTADDTEWATNAEVIISGGSIDVVATCTTLGAISADPATITIIVDPIGGWQSVTNALAAAAGKNPETDVLARIRRHGSVSNPGQNQVDSTFAAVGNISGVSHVRVYENDTGSVDANGLPAHSTDIIVDGGDDTEIAQAIYDERNPGPIQHQSATPVDVIITSAVTGNVKTIKYDRPAYVDAVVVVAITDDGTLPGNAEQLIKDAILNYATGSIDGVVSAFNQTGFSIGEDVYGSQLYTPVNAIIGQYGNSYITSLTVNAGSSLAIAFNELSRWSDANLTVTIT